ncbi:MAG: hypothetical protein LBU65_13400 [Planctomycetaceae bacterium]|jgi:uncharacterized repeat protein (TIGR04138 family)|nr:hypothetical protein [Planctomycetaceae bacterium]
MLPVHAAFSRLLRDDRRYSVAAYSFVSDSLEYAQDVLKLGTDCDSEPVSQNPNLTETEWRELQKIDDENEQPRNHVTGQDLCNAARDFAFLQYGLLARIVLVSIGIKTTSDIGNIVYNLMKIGSMRKTPQDRREDFDNVFDFDTAFDANMYKICGD